MLIFCETGSNLVTIIQHQMLICREIIYLGYICKLREFSFTYEPYGKSSSSYKGNLKGEIGAKCKKKKYTILLTCINMKKLEVAFTFLLNFFYPYYCRKEKLLTTYISMHLVIVGYIFKFYAFHVCFMYIPMTIKLICESI